MEEMYKMMDFLKMRRKGRKTRKEEEEETLKYNLPVGRAACKPIVGRED